MAKDKILPSDNEPVVMDGATYKDMLFKCEWYDMYMANMIPADKSLRNWIYTDNTYSTQACNIEESYYEEDYTER